MPKKQDTEPIDRTELQRYRTRKEPKLELSMDYTYPKAGKYNILVKDIDIFGNDTTKLLAVKI